MTRRQGDGANHLPNKRHITTKERVSNESHASEGQWKNYPESTWERRLVCEEDKARLPAREKNHGQKPCILRGAPEKQIWL